jgi:hypothetical protein
VVSFDLVRRLTGSSSKFGRGVVAGGGLQQALKGGEHAEERKAER